MFHEIDPDTWDRREHYRHFLHTCNCKFSVTVPVDITALFHAVKAENLKLYPALIYLLGRAVNEDYHFRMGFSDGRLGYYDESHPCYTIPNAQEGGFSAIWTEYTPDFGAFYRAYLSDTAQYSASTHYAPKNGQPPNTYYVSCTPALAFTSLDMELRDSDGFEPIFTIGRYSENGGRISVPVALRMHHAVCDGYHVGNLYGRLEQSAANPAFLKSAI